MGGGVCGAIFNAAGASQLQDACDKLAPIETGEAVITPGFKLPAKYVIHTAGPVYRDGLHGEEALLRSCYLCSLELAVKHGCESIAFPLISSGLYGSPQVDALSVASAAIRDFIGEHDIDVSLVVFDKEALTVSEELLGAVESYIDEHYVEERHAMRRELLDVERKAFSDADTLDSDMMSREMMSRSILMPLRGKKTAEMKTPARKTAEKKAPAKVTVFSEMAAAPLSASLDNLIRNRDEPFSATLLRFIDATGRKDSEIYNRANIDRRLFSKIRSNAQYAPSKPTVLAFAVALELNLRQTGDLLERAGFALSHSRKFDVIVEYFIQNRKYDIFEINEVLFSFDQPLLGG
jgi:O-acetyl-ADP-ribose deacetylase (regulator of RNase III)